MDIRKLLSSKKVLVVGDIILDHYVYGKVYRVSPEAPVPVVLKNRSVYCLGGAANVAQNVTSFGSECYLLGVTGDDQSSLVLDDLLKQQSISPFLVKDSSRPTTEKTRIVGNGHQITRIDCEITDTISENVKEEIISQYKNLIKLVHGVILQDYGKGLFSPDLLQDLISIAQKEGKIVLVDPKEKDFSRYSGADWIKPNLLEFKNAVGVSPQEKLTEEKILEFCDLLIGSYGFGGILLTMSEDGMLARSGESYEIDGGMKIEVTDVSGAGDTVSAIFILMQICDITLENSLRVSNLGGSMVCQISGAVPINSDELIRISIKRGWL